jgi:hypothetical protein
MKFLNRPHSWLNAWTHERQVSRGQRTHIPGFFGARLFDE